MSDIDNSSERASEATGDYVVQSFGEDASMLFTADEMAVRDPGSGIPIVSVALVIGAGFFVIAGLAVPERTELLFLGVILVVASSLAFMAEFMINRDRIRRARSTLETVVGRVRSVRNELVDYLTDLDKRTSRYFHCVTNTKVTTYFTLRQIETALGNRVEELDALLRYPSRRTLLEAAQLLQGKLEYRDGFEFNTGKSYATPLQAIRKTIVALREELEYGIESLEDEIRSFDAVIQDPPEYE